MTKREFLNSIMNGEMNEELVAFATNELEKMDTANEKRRTQISKTAAANAPLLEKIENEILCDEPMTATDVAGVLEVSVQKASALCRKLVADGKAAETMVKITGKGKQKAYTKVSEEGFDVNLNGEITEIE